MRRSTTKEEWMKLKHSLGDDLRNSVETYLQGTSIFNNLKNFIHWNDVVFKIQ